MPPLVVRPHQPRIFACIFFNNTIQESPLVKLAKIWSYSWLPLPHQGIHITIPSVSTSWLECWSYSSQGSLLGWAISAFSPPLASTAPPGTIKSRLQDGSFQLGFSTLCKLGFSILGVVSSAVGSYQIALWQWKRMARNIESWRPLGPPLANNTEWGSSYLSLGSFNDL